MNKEDKIKYMLNEKGTVIVKLALKLTCFIHESSRLFEMAKNENKLDKLYDELKKEENRK